MMRFNRIPNWLMHRCCAFSTSYLNSRLIRPAEIFQRITQKEPHSISRLTGGANSDTSWLVRCGNLEFKLFRLSYGQDSDHFLQLIRILRDRGFVLPNVVGFDETTGYVAAEWLKGDNISIGEIKKSSSLLGCIAELQASFHTVNDLSIESTHSNSFYMTEIVFPRFVYWTGIRFGKEMKKRANQLVQAAGERISGCCVTRPGVVTNPDFSVNNLIVTPVGRLAVIDTEFICVDRCAEFEIANFFERLSHYGGSIVDEYASYYRQSGSLEQYYNNKQFWDACVKLRRLGKQAKYFRTNDSVFVQTLKGVEADIYVK